MITTRERAKLPTVRRKAFLNRSETRTLDLLERSLAGTPWQVYAKPRLQDVVGPDQGEQLDAHEESMLRHGHLDFVVINRVAGEIAEFAIEFDGPHHSDELQTRRDRTKDFLCLQADLPVLRINADMIGEREQITILEWAVERFIGHRLGKDQRHDGSHFDRFPALTAAAQRLQERYGLLAADEIGGPSPTREDLDDWLQKYKAADLHLQYHGLSAQLDHLDNKEYDEVMLGYKDHDYLFSLLVYRPKDERELFEVKGQSAFPRQDAVMRELLEDSLGTDVWRMDILVAQYSALMDIERWASRNLVRLDRFH